MKIQDIIFVVILLILIFIRRQRLFVVTGLVCLVLSIPLFYLWIFFTAQHLVYYAAGFFLSAIILLFIQKKL